MSPGSKPANRMAQSHVFSGHMSPDLMCATPISRPHMAAGHGIPAGTVGFDLRDHAEPTRL